MCNIDTGTGKVTYHAVRKAMAGETYTMSSPFVWTGGGTGTDYRQGWVVDRQLD